MQIGRLIVKDNTAQEKRQRTSRKTMKDSQTDEQKQTEIIRPSDKMTTRKQLDTQTDRSRSRKTDGQRIRIIVIKCIWTKSQGEDFHLQIS